jgi:hypothetical protein
VIVVARYRQGFRVSPPPAAARAGLGVVPSQRSGRDGGESGVQLRAGADPYRGCPCALHGGLAAAREAQRRRRVQAMARVAAAAR